MAVTIHRDRDRRVPELLRDQLRRDPLSDQQRGEGVPQVVEPDSRHLDSTKRRPELPPNEVGGIHRAAVAVREDQVVVRGEVRP
jgi:hypothetical protein